MPERQTSEATHRSRARDGTAVVHHALREAILRGDIAAGTSLSQVKIAKDFGISRGPVREAPPDSPATKPTTLPAKTAAGASATVPTPAKEGGAK